MKSDKSIPEGVLKRKARNDRREELRFKRMVAVNRKETLRLLEIESRFDDCSIEKRRREIGFLKSDPVEIPTVFHKVSKTSDCVKDPYIRPCVSLPSSSKTSGELSDGVVSAFRMLMASSEEEMRKFPCLSHGSLSVIGRQRTMEDAVSVVPEFLAVDDKPYDFFAVYDGHGGPGVANACKDKLHQLLAKELKRQKYVGDVDWTAAMATCFLKMDEDVNSYRGKEEDEAAAFKTVGSTAIVVVVGKENIVVANCGDSRAVLCRAGEAVPLSCDHKPDRPDEQKRIEAAGGRILNSNGSRVQGVLATSRSIGDNYLKPHVISEPEVTVVERTENDEFLVVASDGLWDVVSNEFACEVVRLSLNGQLKRRCSEEGGGACATTEAAAVLVELAMARGSKDNISIIVIQLRKSKF